MQAVWTERAHHGREVGARMRDCLEDSLAAIYERIDDLLRAGLFAQVDVILARIKLGYLAPVEMLAYLSTTKPAADLLPGRAAFVERVRAELLERREPADVEELMRGLE